MDFQEAKRPLRTKSVKRPIKARKKPINEVKRPIKAMVLVGNSVGCLMGCFWAPPPWRKTAPLKRPIKRSMIFGVLWKMSWIFREKFCGHFPWKLKDEKLRKISPKFRRIFRRALAKISQELRSGGLRAHATIGGRDNRLRKLQCE